MSTPKQTVEVNGKTFDVSDEALEPFGVRSGQLVRYDFGLAIAVGVHNEELILRKVLPEMATLGRVFSQRENPGAPYRIRALSSEEYAAGVQKHARMIVLFLEGLFKTSTKKSIIDETRNILHELVRELDQLEMDENFPIRESLPRAGWKTGE